MYKRIFIFLSIISFLLSTETKDYDPLHVDTFTLNNGLTVILNEDHNTTGVFGAVVVRGGGKRDPKDATGIAHYLEHLLFKGTQEMGTIDYASEKIYLDSIEIKYEELRNTLNENERLKIQTQINRLSIEASKYAIPNEFDRMIETMGGTWINAFTSYDGIAYLNKFPGDQIEKWLEVYSHRFINPVFRLFQSELEAVYEEKNISMDSPISKLLEVYLENLFKKHPYGQQTILGSVDHLKNPSLSEMKKYFDTYYIANNMALIITGDIDINQIKPLIEEKFGVWKSGEEPKPINITEDPFNGREKVSKRLSPIKIGAMGFRTVPAGHKDKTVLALCQKLLTNQSKTGLVDKLVNQNKLMDAGTFDIGFVDQGAVSLYFIPKLLFQSLNKAEKLINNEVGKLRLGDFSNEYLEAVKLIMLREHEENIENMEGRLFTLVNVYFENQSWNDIMDWPEKLNAISKEDVMNAANQYFGENYFVLHSKMGFPKKHKLEKPPFEPIIPENSSATSEYSNKISKMSEKPLNLSFIEFNEDVIFSDIKNNVHLYCTKNPINSIFNLTLQYGIGNYEKSELEQVAELLNISGTENYSFDIFKGNLQKIGTTISFDSNKHYFTITVKGFDEKFEESLKLLSEFIISVKPNENGMKNLIDNAKTVRKFGEKDLRTVGRSLFEYALEQNKSYYLRRLSVNDIKKLKVSNLMQDFKDAMNYEVDIFYTGQDDFNFVSSKIKEILPLSDNLQNSNSPIDYKIPSWDKNLIYLVNDKDAIQSQIYFAVNGNIINNQNRAVGEAYNKYFGTGMGSIIFQEIREFRSLAYSCYAYYSKPSYNGKKGYLKGYIGCQADKSMEAISIFKDLALNMPEKPERLQYVQSGLIKSINSERPSFRSFPKKVSQWIKMGYNDDPRKKEVEYFKSMTFEDILNFQKQQISSKPMIITILTDKNRINMDELNKFGEIITLTKKDFMN